MIFSIFARSIYLILQKRLFHSILICLAVLLLTSCSISRRVPKGSLFLDKNKVVIKDSKVEFEKSDIKSYIIQEPAKARFPHKMGLWFYYVTEHAQGGMGKWINKRLGTVPEYYDNNAAINSKRQIEQYLDNRGYFNSKVAVEAKPVNNRKKHLVQATYTIYPAQPYRISRIDYQIEDTAMASHLIRLENSFPVQENTIYNAYTLDDQRTFITDYLRNIGYYYFNKDYITYEVDSSFNNHTLTITMRIANVKDRNSEKTGPHKRYTIDRINVFPDYTPTLANIPPVDSTSITFPTGYQNNLNTLHLYYHEPPRIRPNTFRQVIQVIEGRPYRLRQVSQTYNALSNLKIIGNSSIEFDSVPSPNDSINLLKCNIYLRRANQHSFKFQTEGTNTGGDLGISGSIIYTNKNIFKGSEVLQVSLKGGLEAQKIVDLGEMEEESRIFNTRELIFNTSLFIPKFLSPIPLKTFVWDYQPRTTFSLGSSAQIRYAYSRFINMGSFGYDWKANPRMHFIVTPVNLNSVKVYPSPEFQSILDQESNQRLKDQYTNHLIYGGKYTFIYNTQNTFTKPNHYIYLRGTIESSGGIVSLFNRTKLVTDNGDHHELFGIRYAQYLRGDIDFRQYNQIGKNTLLIFRQFIGVGMPYGNSYDMPFERSFYSGGSMGMRGWNYRSLGPGSYHTEDQTVNIERIGDIQLELNAEYRFPIQGSFNGAVFVDAGNIWNYHANELLPGGVFRFDSFYRQIAMDAGLGIRFDMKVAIVRIDLAMPIRNPYPDADGEYWTFHNMSIFDIHPVMNIGYPF